MRNFENPLRKFIKETDKIVFFFSLIASALGLLLVYSATLHNLEEGELLSSDIKTMVVAVLIGVILALLVSSLDYEIFTKLFFIVGGACILLMIVTLVFGVAPPSRPDSKCWLDFGAFYFQASELLKIGFIITFSVHLDAVKEQINTFKNVALLGAHAAIPIGLVILTGDDGSALVFILMFLGMMFAAGLHFLYFVAGFTVIGIGFPLAWVLGLIKGYQRDRFLALFYYDVDKYAKEVAYQQNNAVTAIGSGKLFGKGLFHGTLTQAGAVPESQNDMILSVAGEELGFIGAAAVILLLLIIVLRTIFVGMKARDNTGFLICSGVASMIVGQTFLNIGMCLRLLPVIGITLPFFSAGGSSNLCIYIAVGLVMSIHRSSQHHSRFGMFYTNPA